MEHRLPDGTKILIRPIRPADRVLLDCGIRALSPQSARLRFLGPKPRLSRSELRYLTEVDQCHHYALIAVLRDDPTRMAGVARWVRDAAQPDRAEIAIVVADSLQRQGLGTTLGLLVADAARERRVRRFTASMLSENVAAQRVFARISQRLRVVNAGVVNELVGELAA